MLQSDRQAIEMALRLAHERFGGVLTPSGPADFQERAARIAAESGLHLTFENKGAERIRQERVSELAAERAKRVEHREAWSQFIEIRAKASSPEVERPAKKGESPLAERGRLALEQEPGVER